MRIGGCVVFYNPGPEAMKNIQTYLPFLEMLVVVDNSTKYTDVQEKVKNIPNVVYLNQGSNLGIASALNKGMDYLYEQGMELALTMDQDSRFPVANTRKILQLVEKNISKYAILGLRYKNDERTYKKPTEIFEVNYWITSGNFVKLKDYKKVGLALKIGRKDYKSAEFLIAVASYIMAYGFHKSALIGIALVILAVLLKDIPKQMFFAIPVGIIAVLYFLKAVFTVIVKYFALSSSFMYYINVFIFQKERTEWMLDHYTNALIFDMLFRTVVCVLPFVLLPKYNEKEYCVRVLTLLGYVGYLIPWLTMKTIYGQRISMYADFFLIVLLPYLLTRKIRPRYAVAMVSYGLLSGYWFIWIMIVKWADANVYRFRF